MDVAVAAKGVILLVTATFPRFIRVYSDTFVTQCAKCGFLIEKKRGHEAWAIIGLNGYPHIQYYCDGCKEFIEYPYRQREINEALKGGDKIGYSSVLEINPTSS